MTVIFLPIGLILVFIIAGAGLAYTIMSNIQSILLGGLLGAVLAAVFLGIHFLIGFYRQKTGNILFTICRLLLWVFLLVGWLFCMEVTHLDESRYFFDWLGDGRRRQYCFPSHGFGGYKRDNHAGVAGAPHHCGIFTLPVSSLTFLLAANCAFCRCGLVQHFCLHNKLFRLSGKVLFRGGSPRGIRRNG